VSRVAPFDRHTLDWNAASMRARPNWHFSLSDAMQREAEALVSWSRLPTVAHDPVALLQADSIDTPYIERLGNEIYHEIDQGSGVALVKAHLLSDEAFRLTYMRLGLTLGTPIETYGRLYEVKDVGVSYRETAVPVSQTRESTGMHTDSSGKHVLPRIVGLGCVRAAPRGGDSRLVSVAHVHESLRAKNLPLLERLYDNFVRDVVTPGGDRSPERVAENRFPVFSYSSGRLCLRYMRYWIERGHDRIGEPLDAEAIAAFDALDAELSAPDHVLVFRMSSKEMLFIDNTLVAHDRDAYEDDPTSPRLMLRLWLGPRQLEDTFAVCPECHAPWNLHWKYVTEGGERKRKYNTCGWTRDQLDAKWIHGRSPTP
jgi:hypothetical protein